jgi:hypothetical protein
VQYWSDTHSRWIYGTVRTVHDNGVLDLDEKHGLDPSQVAVRVPDVPGHVQDHQAAWEEREGSRQTSKWPKADCYCCDLVLPCYRAAKAVPHISASPEEVSRVIRETKELCADIDAQLSTIQLYGVDYAVEPPGHTGRPFPLSPGGGASPAETLRMWSWAADGASTITGGDRSARSEWTESATPCSAAAPSPRLDEVFAAAVAEDLRSTLSRQTGARTYKRNGLSKTM